MAKGKGVTSSAEIRLLDEVGIEMATGGAFNRRRLQQLRLRGGGPPFLKDGRRVLYDFDAFRAWMASKTVRSTTDTGRAA